MDNIYEILESGTSAQKQEGWNELVDFDSDSLYIVQDEYMPVKIKYVFSDVKNNSSHVIVFWEDSYGKVGNYIVMPCDVKRFEKRTIEKDSIKKIDYDSKHVEGYVYCASWDIPKDLIVKKKSFFSCTEDFNDTKSEHLRWRRACVMGWFKGDFREWAESMKLPFFDGPDVVHPESI